MMQICNTKDLPLSVKKLHKWQQTFTYISINSSMEHHNIHYWTLSNCVIKTVIGVSHLGVSVDTWQTIHAFSSSNPGSGLGGNRLSRLFQMSHTAAKLSSSTWDEVGHIIPQANFGSTWGSRPRTAPMNWPITSLGETIVSLWGPPRCPSSSPSTQLN